MLVESDGAHEFSHVLRNGGNENCQTDPFYEQRVLSSSCWWAFKDVEETLLIHEWDFDAYAKRLQHNSSA